jgi:hypothetical protein
MARKFAALHEHGRNESGRQGKGVAGRNAVAIAAKAMESIAKMPIGLHSGSMFMTRMLITGTLATTALLAACGKAEPRSTAYFEAHLDEARELVAGCREGSVRGDECANADLAVQQADAKERFRKFRGKE